MLVETNTFWLIMKCNWKLFSFFIEEIKKGAITITSKSRYMKHWTTKCTPHAAYYKIVEQLKDEATKIIIWHSLWSIFLMTGKQEVRRYVWQSRKLEDNANSLTSNIYNKIAEWKKENKGKRFLSLFRLLEGQMIKNTARLFNLCHFHQHPSSLLSTCSSCSANSID